MHILVVLPYSGSKFGGGLSVLNYKLITSLVKGGHRVKLLTMPFSHEAISPPADEHEGCDIIYIPNEVTPSMGVEVGGPKGEDDRNRLYDLINDESVLLQEAVFNDIIKGKFEPELIIGHSRFSGPAAIMLKQRWFRKSCVQYFLHSIPVEGSALIGYEAYEMNMDAEVAAKKFKKEKKWMPQADLVVTMGPLIRAGAVMILEEAKARGTRVHEVVPGITLTDEKPVVFAEDGHRPNLLLCGRASAPIKGLEDLLLAVRQCWDAGPKYRVHVDVLWWEDMNYVNMNKERTAKQPRVVASEYLGEEQWASPVNTSTDLVGDVGTVMSTTRKVDIKAAQKWIDEMIGLDFQAVTLLGKAGGKAVEAAYRGHDAVLMPSYIEHFGLVPFEALGHGVPVLVNQVSGSGMVLADRTRCGGFGQACVVQDFAGSMDDAREYLVDVAPDAFDLRPTRWAGAIQALVDDLPNRFKDARKLRELLSVYTYDDFAASIVEATHPKYAKCPYTYQGPRGSVEVPG